MNCCDAHKSVTEEVYEFISNVPDVKEESITDFLIWKWRTTDKKFKSINVSSFTREEESKVSGADFEMEIWFISEQYVFPLVFQAKKIIEKYNSYVSALRYPKNSKDQLNQLLSYAQSNKRIPFYAFYTCEQPDSSILCQQKNSDPCGIYISHAKTVEKFANKKPGSRVSRDKLIESSNPFHCLFCCPLGIAKHMSHYYRLTKDQFTNIDTPEYVQYLADTHPLERDSGLVYDYIETYNLNRFRHIAVYELDEIFE